MRHVSLRIFFSLLLALTFTACDSDSDDDDGNGNGNGNGSTIGDAEVMVTGAVSDSWDGSAVFGFDEDGQSFGMALFEGGLATGGVPSGALVAFGRQEGRPPTGTYTLGEDFSEMALVGSYASDFSDFNTAIFAASESGTITITTSNDDRVAGSFTFTGQANSVAGPQGEITVSGSFDADFASSVPTTSLP